MQVRQFGADELRNAVEDLAFEMYHFACYAQLCRHAINAASHPTAHQAALYALLLHMRLLLDFFNGPPAQDDIWVGHFRDALPTFAERFHPAATLTADNARGLSFELNKRLAHLTATRWEHKAPTMDYYNPYIDAITALNVRFRDALPDDFRQVLIAGMERWERLHPPRL